MLSGFSLDVVGVVCGYTICGVATPNAHPHRLFTIGRTRKNTALPYQPGEFEEPCCSIALDDQHRLWTSDFQKIHVFSDEGRYLFGSPQHDGSPSAVAVSGEEVFVCAYRSNDVWVSDMLGRLVRRFGGRAQGHKYTLWPWAIAIDSKTDVVAVADSMRVQLFRRDGTFLKYLPVEHPYGIAIAENGDLFVSANQDHCVFVSCRSFLSVFSRSVVQVLTTVEPEKLELEQPKAEDKKKRPEKGAKAKDTPDCVKLRIGSKGSGPNELFKPSGVALDRVGNLLVCDSGNGRVQVFSASGQHITSITGWPSSSTVTWPQTSVSEERFNWPRAVCVDEEGRILISDNDCIHVFVFPV